MNIPARISKAFFTHLMAVAAALTLALGASATVRAEPLGAFGNVEVRSDNLASFTKWRNMLARYEQQRKDPAVFCESARDCPLTAWRRLIERLRHAPREKQLAEVNRFFNRVPYASDRDVWNQPDYWATPYELLTRKGDCEDYAAAKLLTLRLLGVPEEEMRLMIVRDHALGGVVHAVLEVRHGEERFVLDNQMRDVTRETDIAHYKPIFSINQAAWWSYRLPGEEGGTLPAGGE